MMAAYGVPRQIHKVVNLLIDVTTRLERSQATMAERAGDWVRVSGNANAQTICDVERHLEGGLVYLASQVESLRDAFNDYRVLVNDGERDFSRVHNLLDVLTRSDGDRTEI